MLRRSGRAALAVKPIAGIAKGVVLAKRPYVLATRSNHTLRFVPNEGLEQTDPLTLADALPPEAWTAHDAGEGSKGPRTV